MKIKICVLSVLLACTLPSWATLYQFGTLNSQPALGAIPDNNTIGLTETFTASGLNNGISDMVLTIQLQGGVSTDLSGYLRLGSSSYYDLTSLIQGQTLSAGSPTTYTIDFANNSFQSTFSGLDPNGTWTLFFADTVNGDQSTLNGWSLNIIPVPEPTNLALGVFALALCGVVLNRIHRRRSVRS